MKIFYERKKAPKRLRLKIIIILQTHIVSLKYDLHVHVHVYVYFNLDKYFKIQVDCFYFLCRMFYIICHIHT